ncbi:MAG: protein kinase [Bryobacterales bacterium]|nr:protein kinase [Bryobacterales bacterium]
MRRIGTVGLGLWLWASQASLGAYRPVTHPTALNIFSIAEAMDGQLWLAAESGLYRFDGLHFAKVRSYPFVSARAVAVAKDGSVWVGSYEGLARLRAGGAVDVLLRGQDVTSIAAAGEKVFVKTGSLYEFDLSGVGRRLSHGLRRDLLTDAWGRIWSVCLKPDVPCWFDPRAPEALHLGPEVTGFQSAVAGNADGAVWTATDVEALVAGRGGRERLKRKAAAERRRQGPLLPGRNGRLWFVGESIQEVTGKAAFRDRAANDVYPPTAGLEDSKGNLWVAYLRRGLVKWTVEPGWERWFPEDLDGEAPVQVIRDGAGGHVLSSHKHLYRRQPEGGRWKSFTEGNHRFDGVLALEGGEFLAAVRDLGLVRISRQGRVVERLRDPEPDMGYREIVRDAKGEIWVVARRWLVRVEGRPGAYTVHPVRLPGEAGNDRQHVADLEVDSTGRLWVGYRSGIAWLDGNGQWNMLRTDRPIEAVRSLVAGEGEIWAAYRRAGVYSRLRREGDIWKVTDYDPASGYGPPDTNFVKRDSRGWIWRGTTEGVQVADGRHLGPEEWIRIPMGKGLAANETEIFGFFEDTDGSVWIAGEEGLTHMTPDEGWFAAPAGTPRIANVVADGQSYVLPAEIPTELPAELKKLRVEVGTMDGPPFRDVPVRYRLLPGEEEWRTSRDGVLEWTDMPEEEYRLEMAWTGRGKPETRTYAFRVGPPRTTWWPGLLGLAAIAGVLGAAGHYTGLWGTAMFRLEKAAFMLRRRLDRRRETAASRDATEAGTLMAGRYELVRAVSRGGFSQVFEARDREDHGQKVAVKILKVAAGTDRAVRQRFAQEVAAVRSVDHAGVIRILHSWVEAGGEPCIAMPFLEGETLREALAAGPLAPRRAARMVEQIGSALEAVHRLGIVHRDLKPENLMLTDAGTERERVVILDFGTAGLWAGENRMAETRMLEGSFHYMAPERLAGRYSVASDVFSVGVIVLEILTGKRLADFRSMVVDRQFAVELEGVLGVVLGEVRAKFLAERLGMALQADPAARPAQVMEWSKEVAEACRC